MTALDPEVYPTGSHSPRSFTYCLCLPALHSSQAQCLSSPSPSQAWWISLFLLPLCPKPRNPKVPHLSAQPLAGNIFIYQSKPIGVRVPQCLTCRHSCMQFGGPRLAL